MSRTKEKLNDILNNYLKRHHLYRENAPWVIKDSPLGGFGVFTKHDIEPGELIFYDSPIILGPRVIPNIPDMCITCYR